MNEKLKLERWVEDGFPPIDLNANIKGVIDLVNEIKKLRSGKEIVSEPKEDYSMWEGIVQQVQWYNPKLGLRDAAIYLKNQFEILNPNTDTSKVEDKFKKTYGINLHKSENSTSTPIDSKEVSKEPFVWTDRYVLEFTGYAVAKLQNNFSYNEIIEQFKNSKNNQQ